MRFIIVRPLLLLCAILFLPAFVLAQEAVLTGIITDTTSAVLPGVSVQTTHENSGNTFEAVTDGRGVYRSMRNGRGDLYAASLADAGRSTALLESPHLKIPLDCRFATLNQKCRLTSQKGKKEEAP